MLFGHLGVASLLAQQIDSARSAVWLGTVAPDVFDKTLFGLRLAPSTRTAGHSLVALALTTVGVGVVFGRKSATSWAAGYLGHLLCDAGGFVPWLFPLRAYTFKRSDSLGQKWRQGELLNLSALEALILAVAVVSRAAGDTR